MGRRTTIEELAIAAGHKPLVADCKLWPQDPIAVRARVRALVRECALFDAVPMFVDLDVANASVVAEEIELHEGSALVTCSSKSIGGAWGRPVIMVEVEPPSSQQLGELWIKSLGQGSESDAEHLATRYPLAPAVIVRAAEAAKARAGERPIQPDDIYAGIRSVLDDRLGSLARRIRVTQTWDDLVLPDDDMRAVDDLIARIRGRRKVYETWGFGAKVGKGLGVSALLSGPPGTGKTMLAGLIAKDLELELYQVDMAKLVSKYIGETEKQLAELFDAAEAGHAILLFDEADSLFGKRTEVKSSNDRYANLETNYLLQRLETFTGICVLTSNHEANIDPAFQRRLSLHLRFAIPDAEQRAALWRAVLPTAAPVENTVDFHALGRTYEMSGGYIKNAALRAAFAAADEDASIAMHHLERAARLELEGMGRIAA